MIFIKKIFYLFFFEITFFFDGRSMVREEKKKNVYITQGRQLEK
jgi:hypothetical protein